MTDRPETDQGDDDERSPDGTPEPDLGARTYLVVLGLAVALYLLMGWFTSVYQVRGTG